MEKSVLSEHVVHLLSALQGTHNDICYSTRDGMSSQSISLPVGWLGSRVVSVAEDAEGPGFNSQSRRCRVTVLGKLFTSIVPLFTKQQNW